MHQTKQTHFEMQSRLQRSLHILEQFQRQLQVAREIFFAELSRRSRASAPARPPKRRSACVSVPEIRATSRLRK